LGNGSDFQKGANRATMKCRQDRVADQRFGKMHHCSDFISPLIDRDAEKARIGNALHEGIDVGHLLRAHAFSPPLVSAFCFRSASASAAASGEIGMGVARFAASMKVPTQVAIGSFSSV